MYSNHGDTRNFFLRIPGSDLILEPQQFSGSKGKKLDTHVQDPGAIQLIFYTRDLDTLTRWLVTVCNARLTVDRCASASSSPSM